MKIGKKSSLLYTGKNQIPEETRVNKKHKHSKLSLHEFLSAWQFLAQFHFIPVTNRQWLCQNQYERAGLKQMLRTDQKVIQKPGKAPLKRLHEPKTGIRSNTFSLFISQEIAYEYNMSGKSQALD